MHTRPYCERAWEANSAVVIVRAGAEWMWGGDPGGRPGGSRWDAHIHKCRGDSYHDRYLGVVIVRAGAADEGCGDPCGRPGGLRYHGALSGRRSSHLIVVAVALGDYTTLPPQISSRSRIGYGPGLPLPNKRQVKSRKEEFRQGDAHVR